MIEYENETFKNGLQEKAFCRNITLIFFSFFFFKYKGIIWTTIMDAETNE